MRKKIVAGNWKMNTTVDEGIQLAREIMDFVDQNGQGSAEVIICAPFTHLWPVTELLKGSRVRSGAQNCAAEESGAFTGEISAGMITSAGGEYVILGHSERRALFCEDDAVVAKKLRIALGHSLRVILCCGETLPQRNDGSHFTVVEKQLNEALKDVSSEEIKSIVIAYEPVWAIGTGVTASSDQAQEMHAFIRNLIKKFFNDEIAENITLLYGGSCNQNNAAELFGMKDVDGGLIGGASLKVESFCSIIKSF
ncbi:MAG: triose-phosphate isomerase [Bacteroidales bacterium]